MQLKKHFASVAVVALTFCGLATTASAAPDSDLWDYWSPAAKEQSQTVDHSAWNTILDQYVSVEDDLNNFDYGALADSQSDSQSLKSYIASLSQLDPRMLTRPQQLAYWVNLYNALTIDVVLSEWPVGSIRDIRDGVFSAGPWTRKLANISGQKLSLNDVEHRILRPIFNDARIHYAVNCASRGCPNLQPVAYTADNAEQLLNKGAKEFVNSARGVSIAGSKLTVSSIYEWFKVDFGNSDANVIAHLSQYADAPLAEKLKRVTKISRDQYDWKINAISGTAPGAVMQGSDGGISTGGIETKRAQE